MLHVPFTCLMEELKISWLTNYYFMRTITITVILFFLGSFVSAQTNKFNLKQCIDTAIKNNFRVNQTGLQLQVAEVNMKQAKANLLPNLNGRADYGFNFGRNVDPITNTFTNNQLSSSNAGLGTSVVLFNGMRLQNIIQQTNYNYRVAESDYQQEKDNLTLNVILAYMQVLGNEDVLGVSKAQLLVTKKQIERMEVLVKEGTVGVYQLTDMKGQMANEEIGIINLENSFQQAKLNLCQLMNVSYLPGMELDRGEILLSTDLYPQSSAQVIESAMRQMPVVKSNEYKIKSAEKSINIAKGSYYPTISFNGSTGSSYSSLFARSIPTTVSEVQTGNYIKNGTVRTPVFTEVQNYNSAKVGYGKQMNNNLGFFAGVSMQVPLFNNLQVRNRVRLAKINRQTVKLEADNLNYQLKQNIEQAWLNMNASFNRYNVLQEQLANFEESFRAAEVRFENGVINAAEFLIAKNNLDRTRLNLVQGKYEYAFRTKLLDFYQGK